MTLPAVNTETQDIDVDKPTEFAAFVAWSSIPVFLKRPPRDKKTGNTLSVEDFCYSLGIEDEEVIDLAKLTTGTMFCERYGVNKDTLTRWKKKIAQRNVMEDIRQWAQPMTRNVIMSLYNQAVRGGLPGHYELYLQAVAQWSPKMNIDIRKRTIKTVRIEVVDPQHHAE